MGKVLKINVPYLPVSHNKYMAPTIQKAGNRSYPAMYETKESKNWKKQFKADVRRAMRDQKFVIDGTEEGHWFLEAQFTLTKTDQDCANFFKIMLDAMSGVAFNDDKNILPRVHRISYDTKNPRTQLVLRKTNWVGLFDSQEKEDELIEKQCKDCRFYRDGGCAILKAIHQGRNNEFYDSSENECGKFILKKGK